MSDPLTRILARSRGAAPAAIRPRIPAFWERAVTTPRIREEAATVTREPQPEATSSPDPMEPPQRPPVKAAPPNPPVQHAPKGDLPALQPREVLGIERMTRVTSDVSPPEQVARVEPPGTQVTVREVARGTTPPAKPAARDTVREVVRERIQTPAAPDAAPEQPALARPATPVRAEAPAERMRIVPLEVRAATTPPVETAVRPAAATPRAREPQPPVIRVTIGRVDVHAVQEPAPPRVTERREPATRRLELDEYLRRRRGER